MGKKDGEEKTNAQREVEKAERQLRPVPNRIPKSQELAAQVPLEGSTSNEEKLKKWSDTGLPSPLLTPGN